MINFERKENGLYAYDNQKCIGSCTYHIEDKTWVFDHTFVEEEYRSLKLAKQMVEVLVKEAQDKHISLKATCSYVAHYLEKNGL